MDLRLFLLFHLVGRLARTPYCAIYGVEKHKNIRAKFY